MPSRTFTPITKVDIFKEYPLPVVRLLGTATYVQVGGMDTIAVDIDAAGEGAFMQTHIPTKQWTTYTLRLFIWGNAATNIYNFSLQLNKYNCTSSTQSNVPREVTVTNNTMNCYELDITADVKTTGTTIPPELFTVGVIQRAIGGAGQATDFTLLGGVIIGS